MVLKSIEKLRRSQGDIATDDGNSKLPTETLIRLFGFLRYILPPATMISLQVSSTSIFCNVKFPGTLTSFFLHVQYLGVYVNHFTSTILNRDSGPAASLSIPQIQLVFDGCYVKDSRKLFTAIQLQHVRVSAIELNCFGRRTIVNASESFSRSFMHTINSILKKSQTMHVWPKSSLMSNLKLVSHGRPMS